MAELIARRLGYECIAREILLEASEDFNIPAAKLLQAISDAPSMFTRYAYGKERYVAFIRRRSSSASKKNISCRLSRFCRSFLPEGGFSRPQGPHHRRPRRPHQNRDGSGKDIAERGDSLSRKHR
ncbi:MAG: cytidylate kinase-like family protein [Desulfobacterales bacterium]|nr:cytidylate kinase-like family protein [Desulfobacterales bacterium]